jgi:hypothetical protein
VVRADDFVTFDVKLDQLLSRKRELATDMLNGSGDLGASDFDLRDVVPPGTAEGINPRVDIETTDNMTGRYFEGLVAALWREQGNEWVTCTQYSGDHGVDVIAVSGGQGVLIQAKQSSSNGARLGWDVVEARLTISVSSRRLNLRKLDSLIRVSTQMHMSMRN